MTHSDLHGWHLHSPVDNTDGEVSLYLLTEGFPESLLAEGRTPFPCWVDPRAFFHLTQDGPLVVGRVDLETELTDAYLPFGAGHRVDQSNFTPVTPEEMTPTERLCAVIWLLENYRERLFRSGYHTRGSLRYNRGLEEFLADGKFSLGWDDSWCRFWRAEKPFVFFGSARWGAHLNAKRHSEAWYGRTEELSYPAVSTARKAALGQQMRSMRQSPDEAAKTLQLWPTPFSASSDELSESLHGRPMAHSNAQSPHLRATPVLEGELCRHPSTTFLCDEVLYAEDRDSAKAEVPRKDGWLAFPSHGELIVGHEESRYVNAESLLIQEGTAVKSISPLLLPGILPPTWSVGQENAVGARETSSTFLPSADPLSAIEKAADYLFTGTIGGRVVRERKPGNGLRVEVAAPLAAYLRRRTLASQVQLAACLARLLPAFPVATVLGHPTVSETDTYEVLNDYHRGYGAAGRSRKDKAQLFRDIEEAAHERARVDFQDIAAEETPIDLKAAAALTERPLLVSPAGSYGTRPPSVAKANSSPESPHVFTHPAGSLVRPGALKLTEDSSLGGAAWKTNLHILGRIRGKSVFNPRTSPIINFERSEPQVLMSVPEVPEVDAEMTDRVREAAESLWNR